MELTKEILEQVLDEKLVAQTKAFDSKLDTRFEAQTKAFDSKLDAQSKVLMAHSEGLQAELAVMVADEVVERLEANNSMNQRMQKLESQMVEIREALHLSPSR
jgi:hypothetical protein